MENIMKIESVLPENFDGTFRFTNWTDEEFVGEWGSKQYHFPPHKTSPMIMSEHSPLEIQQIRKHFAKKLAEREFFKGEKYANLMKQEKNNDGSPRLGSIHGAGTYSLDDLTPNIQRCLEPLEEEKASVTNAPKVPLENILSRNNHGELNTEAIDEKTSLRARALGK